MKPFGSRFKVLFSLLLRTKSEIGKVALLLALFATAWPSQSLKACDSCVLFAGVTPDASVNQAGLFFRYRTFSGLNHALGSGTNKTDHFQPGGVFGQVNEGEEVQAKETFLTTRAFFRYFIHPKWYLQIEVPFVSNHYREPLGSLGMTGLGDITVTGGYELVNSVKEDRLFQTFVSAGLKLPTGSRFQTMSEKLDWFDLQGSTESFDVQTSVMATWRKGKWGWQGQGMYRINTESSSGMRFGNFLNLRAQALGLFGVGNGNVQLMPFVGGLVEHHSGRYFVDSRVYGTGGTIVSAVTGLSIFTNRISVQPEVQIPVWQDLNDIQLKAVITPTLQVSVLF